MKIEAYLPHFNVNRLLWFSSTNCTLLQWWYSSSEYRYFFQAKSRCEIIPLKLVASKNEKLLRQLKSDLYYEEFMENFFAFNLIFGDAFVSWTTVTGDIPNMLGRPPPSSETGKNATWRYFEHETREWKLNPECGISSQFYIIEWFVLYPHFFKWKLL